MAFSDVPLSLAVKDLGVSRSLYERLGFRAMGGDPSRGWLILRNGSTVRADRAELMQHAVENHKRVRELLYEWELLSAIEIIAPEPTQD